jgi:DNA-binding NtrC family response regulator
VTSSHSTEASHPKLTEDKMNNKPHILVIDDEVDICDMIRRWFGFEVRVSTVTNPFIAIDLVSKVDYDCIIIDYSMPEMSGMEVLNRLHASGKPLPPLVMMSGHNSVDLAMNFMRSGGADFFEKPLNLELLSSRIQHLCQTYTEKKLRLEFAVECDFLWTL